MVTLLIPGQIMQTEFQMEGLYAVYNLQDPKSIHNIGVALTRPLENNNVACCIYFSIPPYLSLHFLGAIANQRVSDIFATNFALNPEVNNCSEIKLCFKIEPIDKVSELILQSQKSDFKQEYAKKVAENLFNYMESCNVGNSGSYLTVPTNVFNSWFEKFLSKYKYDPNFVLNTKS